MGVWGEWSEENDYTHDDITIALNDLRQKDPGVKQRIKERGPACATRSQRANLYEIDQNEVNPILAQTWDRRKKNDITFAQVGVVMFLLKQGLDVDPKYLRLAKKKNQELLKDSKHFEFWADPTLRRQRIEEEITTLNSFLRSPSSHHSSLSHLQGSRTSPSKKKKTSSPRTRRSSSPSRGVRRSRTSPPRRNSRQTS